jgi:hypothetical protein
MHRFPFADMLHMPVGNTRTVASSLPLQLVTQQNQTWKDQDAHHKSVCKMPFWSIGHPACADQDIVSALQCVYVYFPNMTYL